MTRCTSSSVSMGKVVTVAWNHHALDELLESSPCESQARQSSLHENDSERTCLGSLLGHLQTFQPTVALLFFNGSLATLRTFLSWSVFADRLASPTLLTHQSQRDTFGIIGYHGIKERSTLMTRNPSVPGSLNLLSRACQINLGRVLHQYSKVDSFDALVGSLDMRL